MFRTLLVSKYINFYILSNGIQFFLILNRLRFLSFFFIPKFFVIDRSFRSINLLTDGIRLAIKKLTFLYICWSRLSVCKIKFRHKITWFKISRKYQQQIRFNLGLSHFTYVFFNNVRFFRKKKYLTYHNFVLWSNNYLRLKQVTLFLKVLQPISPYTQRGFRFARDSYVKRPGKASSYAHLKSKLF